MANKLYKSPVTIIYGAISQSGILVAADSRTTQTNGYVRDDSIKIHQIIFQNGTAIVGHSGNAEVGNMAVEIIQQNATGKTMTDYRFVADLVSESLADVKSRIRKQFHGTSEELQRHFENYDFSLLIANYFDSKPYLFTCDFSIGIADHKKGVSLIALGCGGPLGLFVFQGMDFTAMSFSKAFPALIYGIKKVKQFDPRCGGQTQVGIVAFTREHPTVGAIFAYGFVNNVDSALAKLDESFTKDWNGRMQQVIEAVEPNTRGAISSMDGILPL